MKKNKYTLRVYAFFCAFVAFAVLHAQDTMRLKEVDVSIQKTLFSATGKKTDHLDSSIREQFIYSSVADVLSLNSSVFIKNYGPGAVATTALRGGNASQTAVLWNGFNIQNSMLGQTDLSLLPTVLFDDVRVEYGGSSSLWGTGAVAGSIQLLNPTVFNHGLTTRVNVSGGSFGLFNTSAVVNYSKERFYSSTRLYLQNSNNTFTYKDTLDKEQPLKQQRHASYGFMGVMQQLKFILTSKQSLDIHAWYNNGKRQIPSGSPTRVIPATQQDGDLRTSASWNYYGSRFSSTAKGAFFSNMILYNDSVLAVYSDSRLNTFIAENENIFRWKHHAFNFGANFTQATAVSNNYTGAKEQSKVSVLAGNKFSFFDRKLIVYPALRAEYFSAGNLPVTGNIAVEYKLLHSLTAKLNGAKVYRQPTFNELYWRPGGNPNLKPEQGYTAEGDLSYEKKIKYVFISLSGSAFYRIIDDWILWLPGSGSPTPVNLQQVWSRGTETKWQIGYMRDKFKVSATVFTAYTLSTITKSEQENDESETKQLIYTPRYMVNSNLTFAYEKINLTFYHQYVGYRFTTSDNSQWLMPYHYSGIRLNMHTSVSKETGMTLFAACNNIFNTNYSIVSGRYMPLRNYEIGVSLMATKKKQKNINEIIEINNP